MTNQTNFDFDWRKLIPFQDSGSANGYRRHGHTCSCLQNCTLLCHAGSTVSTQTKDTYIFNPSAKVFSVVESPAEMDGREDHAVAYIKETNQLYMYGGIMFTPAGITLDDLWMMQPDPTLVEGGKKSNKMSYLLNTAFTHPLLGCPDPSTNPSTTTNTQSQSSESSEDNASSTHTFVMSCYLLLLLFSV